MKLPHVGVLLGVLGAVVLVIVVGGALILPRLVDSQLIKDKIRSEFLSKTKTSISFAKITLLWFPQPTVLLENAKISFDDRNRASIPATKIYPSIVYLLTGRLVVRRVVLQAPKIVIQLPTRSTSPIDLDELEKQIRSVLIRLTTDIPAPRIDLSNGSAEIRIGDLPPVTLENVAAQTVASPAELRIELRSRSNLFEGLSVEGKISPANLAAQLDIGVRRLKINQSIALLPRQISDFASQGEASMDFKIISAGLRRFNASLDGSAGPVVLARHGGTATIDVKRIKGGIIYHDGAFQINVEQLDLGSPRLKASGLFKIDSASYFARLTAREFDLAEVGDLGLRLAGDTEGVKKILRYVPVGTISEMNFQSAGHSMAEMASSKNIVASGLMRDCKVFIPGPNLELTDVSGSVRMANNILEAKGVTANLGATKGRNGTLKLGFEGNAALFHLDMLVHTGAPELQAVLLKLVRAEAIRGELLKLRNVEGELSGRLILGETLDGMSPVVSVSQANLSATYEPVPFPIEIRGGRINYEKKIIKLENAQGSVGRSTFAGLGATLHYDESRQIKVDSGRISLDLQQLDTLVRRFKDVGAYFTKFQSTRGQIELQKFSLAGIYDEPAGWNFATTGSFNQIEIRHGDFPDWISLARGKFTANQGRIIFSETAATMSDAAVLADGSFEYKQGVPVQFETSATGTVGGQMTQWISRYVELPDELTVRSPLRVNAARLAWRAGGDVSFRGLVTVAGGPEVSVEAVKQPQGLALPNVTIDDGERHARMAFHLARNHLGLSFSGELTQQTIDKIFASSPMTDGSLRGDIQITAALTDPISVVSKGQLSGSNLLFSLGVDKALIDKFSIEANGENVTVRSAEVRWGQSRLAASGKVVGAKGKLLVDLNVTGDRLDWEQLRRSFVRESKPPQPKKAGVMSIPDVEGTIRLKTDSFTFERFKLTPLESTTVISPAGITTEINRGVVCGINTTGRIDFADKDLSLDLRLSAQDADLEPATICLTNQQSDIRGTYSLTARITGRGERKQLRSALTGDFQFSARDGAFVRSAGIDATFDYLNGTGDFAVNFPDLNKQAFPYRLLSAKGTIDGESLFSDELIIQASPYTVTGAGSVDLQRRQVDVKGLVSVAMPANQVIKRIPIIGAVVGGSLVGIPVRIRGSLDRPEVNYLSPADVGAELLNLPMRILGAPLEAIRLFTPSSEHRDKNNIP